MSKVKISEINILGDEETSGSQEDDSSLDGSLPINIGPQRLTLRQPAETPVTRHIRGGAVKEQIQTNSASATSLAPAKDKKLPQKQKSVAVRKPRKSNNPVQREKRLLQEMRHLQKQERLLMPRLPFSRLVRELMMTHSVEVTQIQRLALEALQEASEMYLTQQLQDAYTLTLHRGRLTLGVSDMELLRFIRGRY